MLTVPTIYGFSLEVDERTYVGQFLRDNKYWEGPESSLVRKLVRRGDWCVDGGSYIGYYAALMAECGAEVMAFEPNPKNAELMRRNVRRRCANVQFWANAIGDQNDFCDFYLTEGYDDGWSSIVAGQGGDRSKKVTVNMVRLDRVLPLGTIRLIKLDVEGAEAPALRGLGERLADVDYILVECIDLPYRLEHVDSSVARINEILAGWSVWGWAGAGWERLKAAYDPGNGSSVNILFGNPLLKGGLMARWNGE